MTARPATSGCRCKSWPCACACHRERAPRLTLGDYVEAVAYRVWRFARAVERKIRDITGDV